jgi:hypothetical protein
VALRRRPVSLPPRQAAASPPEPPDERDDDAIAPADAGLSEEARQEEEPAEPLDER